MNIKGFRGEYHFLSNFHPSPIVLDGILFKTAEHLYQGYKALYYHDMLKIAEAPNPRTAKGMGRTVLTYPTFHRDRVRVMERVLYLKFKNNNHLREKLLDTGDSRLVEENGWNDRFWGTDLNGVGDNNLGILLMQLRTKFKENPDYVYTGTVHPPFLQSGQ